jgi:ATP-binding cassette subfamily B (MDR/TAP) protein 1
MGVKNGGGAGGGDPEKRGSVSDSDGSVQIAVPAAAASKDELADELAHLPEHEREIIRRQIEVPDLSVTYFQLYRFATVNDLIMIFVGCVTSIIGGAILPMMTILFGELAQVFQDFALGTISKGHMQHEINRFTLYVQSLLLCLLFWY